MTKTEIAEYVKQFNIRIVTSAPVREVRFQDVNEALAENEDYRLYNIEYSVMDAVDTDTPTVTVEGHKGSNYKSIEISETADTKAIQQAVEELIRQLKA